MAESIQEEARRRAAVLHARSGSAVTADLLRRLADRIDDLEKERAADARLLRLGARMSKRILMEPVTEADYAPEEKNVG